MFCCDFLIDESIQIKHDPLKVNYQHLRGVAYPRLLSYVHLLLAELTFVISYHLPVAESVE